MRPRHLPGIIGPVGLATAVASFWIASALTPAPSSPVWHPVEVLSTPSATPSTEQSTVPEEDVSIPASKPERLQIPSINFDSNNYELLEWDQAKDEAHNGLVDPKPWATAIVWDSTVAGGGQPGTDAAGAPPRFLAHTTPGGWSTQAPFGHLREVRVGDPVAITTERGLLCYNVVDSSTAPKGQLNVVYSKEISLPGIVLLITCDRPPGMLDNQNTTDNRVVTLQLNQQSTNAGSCW